MLTVLKRTLGQLYRPFFFASKASLTAQASVAVALSQRLVSHEKKASQKKENLTSLMGRVLSEELDNLETPLECLIQGVGFQRSSSVISSRPDGKWKEERYLYLARAAYQEVIEREKKLPEEERVYTGKAFQHLGQVYARLGRAGESKQVNAKKTLQAEQEEAYQIEAQNAFQNAEKFKELAQQFTFHHRKHALTFSSAGAAPRVFSKAGSYEPSFPDVDNQINNVPTLHRYIR